MDPGWWRFINSDTTQLTDELRTEIGMALVAAAHNRTRVGCMLATVQRNERH